MINQIKKNAKDIQIFLNDIESIDLFQKPSLGPDDSLAQCKVRF